MQDFGWPSMPTMNPNFGGLGGGGGNFMNRLGGALFPVDPTAAQSMSPAQLQQARSNAFLQMGLGMLAAKERGSGLGAGLFDAFRFAQSNHQGAMDNAFQNTLLKRDEERADAAEERQQKASTAADRQDRGTTAQRLSAGLANAKDQMGYWGLVQGLPEVKEALSAYGIDPASVTSPEQLQQVAGQLSAAGQVSGPALAIPPLQLKSVIDPQTGKQVLVPEEAAIGLEPGYAPPMVAPTYQLSSMDLPGGMRQNVIFDPRKGSTPQPVGEPFKPPEQSKATDTNQMAAGYLMRMSNSEQLLGQYTPNVKDFALAGQVLGGNAAMSATANQFMSPEGQAYYQAAADWVRAKLRKESGAVISKEEMITEIRTYFPVPGDSKKVVEQKAKARKTAMQAMRQAAGPAAPASAAGASGSWDEGWKMEPLP